MRWIHTSDIHGADTCRTLKLKLGADLLSDGGDCLQGSAWTCYANEEAKKSGSHLVACEMNEMEYDVGVIGNHDIEAGRDTLNCWVRGCQFPVLAANVTMKGVHPYTIIMREGMRIAVLGLVTTAVRHWIAREKWCDLHMADVIESARKWVEVIHEKENADIVVAILHSGWEGGMNDENVTRRVAEEVEGLDLILYGHDHHANVHRVRNRNGKEVLCVGAGGDMVGVIDFQPIASHTGTEASSRNGSLIEWNAELANMKELGTERLEERYPAFKSWLNTPICTLSQPIIERDSFFGPSTFISLFHHMQLWATATDISFASPVNFDSRVEAGIFTIRDLFTLYRFNTELYTISLTGKEIHDALEMSYALWANRMKTEDDEALLMDYILDNGTRKGLKNISLNMLSASGIEYVVNLTKEAGQRVCIKRMSDGLPFSFSATYKVAVNSYHASGGGDILTKGAGIPLEELQSRVLAIHQLDSRECLRAYLLKQQVYAPLCENNWSFVPAEWTEKALLRDRFTIFSQG